MTRFLHLTVTFSFSLVAPEDPALQRGLGLCQCGDNYFYRLTETLSLVSLFYSGVGGRGGGWPCQHLVSEWVLAPVLAASQGCVCPLPLLQTLT